MVSSPLHKHLTTLQLDLIDAFFSRESRFFLTGGAALSGFYLGHRSTDDLDLFAPPGPDLADAVAALNDAACGLGATAKLIRDFKAFKRMIIARGDESCVVDLVIDAAPAIDVEKKLFGRVRVDTLREIAANKVCAVLGRSEIKDLVDLEELAAHGVDIEQAVRDAAHKDAAANSAMLAWVLDAIKIGAEAVLPAGIPTAKVEAFRVQLVTSLRAVAHSEAEHSK